VRALAPLLALVALAACTNAAQQMGGLSLAQSNLRKGDLEDALVHAESVIIRGDAEPGAQLQGYFVKAQILEQLDRKKEAAGLYEYIVRVSPASELGYLAKARGADLGEICTGSDRAEAAP
jgi:hypothetical protein